MLWVVASRTNRNPRVVAANFLDFLKAEKLAPRVIRMDAGTENVMIANMQRAIRSYDVDPMAGDRSVIIGPSTANQVEIFPMSSLFSNFITSLCIENLQQISCILTLSIYIAIAADRTVVGPHPSGSD